MSFIYANNVNTTLAAPITSTSAVSMTLSSTANAPSPSGGQIWVVTLNDAATQGVFEIVYVTARTGAVCTITRGQDGTAATTWLANDFAFGGVTAGILNGFVALSPTAQQSGSINVSGPITAGGGVNVGGNALTNATTGGFSGTVTAGGLSIPTGTAAINTLNVANTMTLNGGVVSTQGDFGLSNGASAGRIWFGTTSPISLDYGVGAAGTFTAGAAFYCKTAFGFFASAAPFNMAPNSNDLQFRPFGTSGQFDFVTVNNSGFAQINASVFNVSSDRNLKNDIVPVSSGLDTVMALKPVSYTLKADGQKHIGFIAQDVESVMPTAVSRHLALVDESDETIETLGLNYLEMIPYIVRALQEQQAELLALKA